MQPSTNIDIETENTIFNIIKSLGSKDNKERITLLYLTIDYIFDQDKNLRKDHKSLITRH